VSDVPPDIHYTRSGDEEEDLEKFVEENRLVWELSIVNGANREK
jgi:hypothetical protein